MKNIMYQYVSGSEAMGWGQLKREKNATTHQVVSEVVYPPKSVTENHLNTAGWVRTEVRGDGATRTFNYHYANLSNYSDFKNQFSWLSYDSRGFRATFTNARGHTTSTAREPVAGAPVTVTHPGDNSTVQTSYTDWNNPHHVASRTDELGRTTYFDRDGNNRIWRTRHPNGAEEIFTYNHFGQVLTHRLTNGGTESFGYDERGLKRSFTNAEGHTTTYHYRWDDRLWQTIDPLGRSSWLWYNQRGQVIEVKHDDQTTINSGYNPDGTLAWTADESHANAVWNESERTRYTYDEYKRVLTVTNPLGETATTSYEPWNGSGSLSHTTGFVFRQTLPSGRVVDQDADENFRPFIKREAPFTPDDAMTWFECDPAGNLIRVQDPRGHVTWHGYDHRNRRSSTTNPHNETTWWEYDAVGNKRFETRPDGHWSEWQYNAANQLVQTYGFGGEGTTYFLDHGGRVRHIRDSKGAWYDFNYDYLNRKRWAQYPPDATGIQRSESWHYDPAGNLEWYRNPAGEVKSISYDNRNRPDIVSWSGHRAPTVDTDYDAAGRLTRVATSHGGLGNDTIVAFGYDEANRQIWEDQTFAGVTRRVETLRDGDGLRWNLHVAGVYQAFYEYTQRAQLARIKDGNANPFFDFTYDANGNLTRRQANWNFTNASNFGCDELNRMHVAEQTGPGDAGSCGTIFSTTRTAG